MSNLWAVIDSTDFLRRVSIPDWLGLFPDLQSDPRGEFNFAEGKEFTIFKRNHKK